MLTLVHHYQGKTLENKFFGFFCCKPRVGEPTTVFLSGFKGLINPRNIISNIIMIFNINSTRGQTWFLACVARVICLVNINVQVHSFFKGKKATNREPRLNAL